MSVTVLWLRDVGAPRAGLCYSGSCVWSDVEESIWGGESSVEEKREKLMDQRQTAVMSEAGSTGLQEPVMHMSVQFQVL